MALPRYGLLHGHFPVKAEPTSDGGMDVQRFDPKAKKWVSAPEMMMELFFLIDRNNQSVDIEIVDKAACEAKAKELAGQS